MIHYSRRPRGEYPSGGGFCYLCKIHSPLKEKTSFSTSERASSAIVQRR